MAVQLIAHRGHMAHGGPARCPWAAHSEGGHVGLCATSKTHLVRGHSQRTTLVACATLCGQGTAHSPWSTRSWGVMLQSISDVN